ncbi:BTAD domain-containing putative transcriptional regulator [Nocardia takedensis]|uniref:BTAD domain-containing putative transcriptional regulator n=1 Tax=Nocardia takedensis TaxID=259390 RepID=UPI0002F8F6F5|nr:BTAD domain-containing putative transcriptional regulator [Nocardia takedensis]
MTDVRVQVFGPLRVVLDGRTARIQAGRQQALLGRLVLAGGTATRVDRLIEDVWEGSPPAHAASVLQVQVHNLRRVLEPARQPRSPACVLVSEDGGYALRLDPESVDSWRFERLLNRYEQHMREHGHRTGPAERHRMLDEALECWHGSAFETFATAPWAADEVARLSDRRATAMEMRARAAAEMGRDAEVVAGLHQIARDNPGREECARLLATAQYRLGQQVDALATVRRTREHLRSEYGIDPGHRLHELEMAILTHSLRPESAAIDTAPVPVLGAPLAEPASNSSCYPEQAAAIRAAAAAAAGGAPRLLWLVGPAGIGKTTLLTGMLAELSTRGWRTAFASCPELDGAPPGWVWTELLEELAGAVDSDAGDGVFGTVRAAFLRCREVAAQGPIALAIDGAHRADAATLQGVRQLMTWLHGEAVLVVVTVRGPEPVPGWRMAESALADLISERVELAGLDLAGTRELVSRAGVESADDQLIRTLHERTGGNPMLLRIWAQVTAATPESAELPQRIRALILDGLERLPPGSLVVLRYLTLWNAPLGVEALAGLSGLVEERVSDLLDTAVAAALVRFDDDGRVVPHDELVHRIVHDGIPPLRRRRMQRDIAEFAVDRLVSGAIGDVEPIVLVGHAVHAAPRTAVASALVRLVEAARRAQAAGRAAEAATLWYAASELSDGVEGVDVTVGRTRYADLVEALCLLSDAAAHRGDRASAARIRERALDLAECADDTDLVVRALTCWTAPVLPGVRYRDLGAARIRSVAGDLLAGELPDAARAALLTTLVFESHGVVAAAQRYAHAVEALAAAYHAGEPALICAALNAVTCALVEAGAPELCGPPAAEMLRIATVAGSGEHRALALYLRLLDACRLGDPATATRCALEALTCVGDGRFTDLRLALRCFLAATDLLRGDVASAAERYAACRAAAGAWDEDTLLLTDLAVAWAREDLAPLRDTLEHRYAAAPERFAHVYALAAAQAGEIDRARLVFQENPPSPHDPARSTTAAFAARAAVTLGATEAAAPLFERLSAWSGELVGLDTGIVAFGPMDLLLARLAECAGEHTTAAGLSERAREQTARVRALVESVAPQLALLAERCAERPERRAAIERPRENPRASIA